MVFGFHRAKIIRICRVVLLQGFHNYATTATTTTTRRSRSTRKRRRGRRRRRTRAKTQQEDVWRDAYKILQAAVWQEHHIVLCTCAPAGHMNNTNAHITIRSPYSIAGLRSSTIIIIYISIWNLIWAEKKPVWKCWSQPQIIVIPCGGLHVIIGLHISRLYIQMESWMFLRY